MDLGGGKIFIIRVWSFPSSETLRAPPKRTGGTFERRRGPTAPSAPGRIRLDRGSMQGRQGKSELTNSHLYQPDARYWRDMGNTVWDTIRAATENRRASTNVQPHAASRRNNRLCSWRKTTALTLLHALRLGRRPLARRTQRGGVIEKRVTWPYRAIRRGGLETAVRQNKSWTHEWAPVRHTFVGAGGNGGKCGRRERQQEGSLWQEHPTRSSHDDGPSWQRGEARDGDKKHTPFHREEGKGKKVAAGSRYKKKEGGGRKWDLSHWKNVLPYLGRVC